MKNEPYTGPALPQGTKVECNGYEGTIVRFYASATYEILLPGGLVASSDFRIIETPTTMESIAREREIIAGDVRIVDNIAEDRVQVFYPSKPDAETRDKLKAHGFRWAPSSGAWQAYRSANTAYRIKDLFGVQIFLAR